MENTVSSHPFVIPFAIGVAVLFGVLIVKFAFWIYQLGARQKRYMIRNIISVRTLKAIWEAIRECLFHRNIFKTNPVLGYMHFSLAFGWFLLILVGRAEAVSYAGKFWVSTSLSIFFRFFADPSHHYPFERGFTFLMDFLLLFVLSGLLLAFIKRFYSRLFGMKKATKHSVVDRIALSSLWLIFPLRLLAESITAQLKHNGGFLTQTVGDWLSFLPAADWYIPLWWAYSIALGVFFICMPFTRYMHIFTEVLLVFLRRWGVAEEDKKTGYTSAEINSCSRCGICIDVCPLETGAGLPGAQPVYFFRDIRQKKLTPYKTHNCLLCNRCTEACPVGIETTKIRQIYRHKENFDGKSYYEFISTEQPSAPEKNRILYFAGCMSHLTPGIIQSMKEIFEASGDRFTFLDEEKNICCGRPLKQQGFLDQAYALEEKLTQWIHSYDADILVTSCPICYTMFRRDYELHLKVMHHTQYIDSLIKDQKIRLSKKETLKLAYHDPCEISRKDAVYEEPRNILRQLGLLVPVSSEKESSYCCGGSLGNSVIGAEEVEAMRDEAFSVLTAENPDKLITSCPLCKKTFLRGDNRNKEVWDIAEIVTEHLEKQVK